MPGVLFPGYAPRQSHGEAYQRLALAASQFLWQPIYNNEAAAYPRVIQLQHAGDANGKLLATFEHWFLQADYQTTGLNSNGTASSFVVRESDDQGSTWETVTTVSAPEGVPNLYFYQPFLFEFPQQLGNYPEGTLLLVGNLHDGNTTAFFSWRSMDRGRRGMRLVFGRRGIRGRMGRRKDSRDRLVAVFSDERDYSSHSQMIVHVVSEDGGDTWSDVVWDVAASEQSARPGMATVAKMDNGQYWMSYEWWPLCGPWEDVPDGVSWNQNDAGVVVSSTDSVEASGTPYSIWDPVGQQLIVSSRSQLWYSASAGKDKPGPTAENRHVLHINTNHGQGDWYWASAPWYIPAGGVCPTGYSPNLLALTNGSILLSANTQADGEECEESTGAAPVGIMPYRSDFGTAGDAGWIEFDGLWSIFEDQFAFSPAGDQATIVLTGSSGWTDYQISANAMITSGSGVVGILVRASNSATGPNGLSRYAIALDSSRGDFALYQVGDFKTDTLHSEPVPGGVQVHQQYHLSLSTQGRTLVATLIDGGGTSTSFTFRGGELLRGAAGLFGSNGSGSFRDVQITRV
ncbi:hypothetical protein N7470_007501 [Penicillium chermesinum]|nr:hypothetical protein N7470_007501 [Penicillium chermesinum]